MPGFMGASMALTVFRVDNPAAVTAGALKKHAFQSIDSLKGEELAVGWTSIEDMLDTAWSGSVPEKGQWLCFALRVDKRKVPAAVLKKHYEEALHKETQAREAAGEGPVSRGRKRDLKELTRQRLLAATEPAPSVVDVAMHMHTGLLLVASGSKGALDQLAELMAASFGISLAEFEPQADVQRVLRALYDDALQADVQGHGYALADAGCVTLAGVGGTKGDDAIEVVVKNDRASADAGLASGLAFAKLKVRMERDGDEALVWSFALNTGLSFSGLKLPASQADRDEADAALLERFYLMEQAVGVVHKLFDVR